MRHWLLISIATTGLLFWAIPGFSAPVDIAYFHTETLTVEKKGQSYRLTGEVEIQKRFLSERSAEHPVDLITEQYFSKIDKIKASYDQGSLEKRRIEEKFQMRHDEFFNEERVWLLHWPPVVGVGSRVNYQYREKYDDLAYLSAFVVPNLNEVREFVVRLIHPDDLVVDFEFFFARHEIPYTIRRPTPRETVLEIGTIPFAEPLPYFEHNDFHCMILPRFSRAEQLVNPVEVAEFCRWYWENLEFEPVFLPGQAAALTERFAGDRARLRDISDYVRDTYRYVLDASRSHSIWPHSPSELEAFKYGDCKDRAYLVRAIGLLAGLDVHMATISYDPDIPFDGTHATLFDHVICAANSDTGLVFFDPTAKYHPYGSLAEALVGRQAVILDPANPRRVEIPNSLPAPRLDVSISAQCDSLSRCPATIVAGGDFRAEIARARSELTPVKFQERMDEMLTERLININLDSFVVVGETDHEVTLSAVANLAGFLTVSPRRVYLPQTPFLAVKPDILTREFDSLPIAFEYRQDWRLSLSLVCPGATVQAGGISIRGGSGVTYAAEAIQIEGDTARFAFHLRRGVKTFKGEERRELLSFCRSYLGARNQMFTIEGVKE